MTERKLGDKTLRFLDKRMRWKEQSHEWTFYRAGKWELGLAEHGTGYICTLENESIECVTARPTAEAAILECEAQALALFKQLGELCGKRGRE